MTCPDCDRHCERADMSDLSANEAEAKLAQLAALAREWQVEAERVETLAEMTPLGAPSYRLHLATANTRADCAAIVLDIIGDLP